VLGVNPWATSRGGGAERRFQLQGTVDDGIFNSGTVNGPAGEVTYHRYTIDCWWGLDRPKAARSSYRGMVAKPSPIRLSLCPGSDEQVNYNVREQSNSRPSSRYK